MSRLLKIPLRVNKKNGQINSYFKKKQLPKEVLNHLKTKNGLKKLVVQVKGVEW